MLYAFPAGVIRLLHTRGEGSFSLVSAPEGVTKMKEEISPAKPATSKPAERVISVDALRGFDMFWIVGADHLARSLGKVAQDNPVAQFFATQLKHVSWEGLRFYDLIFPLFIFLLGMSVVFSLPKYLEENGKKAAHIRLFRRFFLLFLLGAFYDSGISDLAHESPFSGVLQRLAWCYLFTALCFIHLRLRGQIIVFLTILIGYWALLTFVPAPGVEEVTFAKNENIVNWFDYKFLPFKEEGQYSDPEGLLSTIPAVASGLLGLFAGLVMRNKDYDARKRLLLLIGGGLALLACGYLLSLQTPIIKRIWTSSYVLVAGGYCCLLLAAFYYVVDIRQLRKWAIPFIWIGANPLLIYLTSAFVDFEDMGARVVGGPIAGALGGYGDVLITIVGIVFVVLFARFLYVRKIYLRV